MLFGRQNCPIEITFESAKSYPNPFNDLELDVVFTDPEGEEHKVPAYWAGENCWKVRYSSPKTGLHK